MRAVQQTLGRRAAPPRGAARPACAPAAAAAHTAVDADVPADYGERYPPKPPARSPARLPPPVTRPSDPAPAQARRAGVLLHPTSLPGPFGAGDLGAFANSVSHTQRRSGHAPSPPHPRPPGPAAYEFVDWLAAAGLQAWQVLPLVPPDTDYWSPYSGRDAHCGNPALVSLELLADEGLLAHDELPPADAAAADGPADLAGRAAAGAPLLARAAAALLRGATPGAAVLRREMRQFRDDPANGWLEPAALFAALEAHRFPGLPWWEWPDEALRGREPAALAAAAEELAGEVDGARRSLRPPQPRAASPEARLSSFLCPPSLPAFCAIQFLFDRQWRRLRAYANRSGVSLVGDMPIYVGAHSADVWCRPRLWQLGPGGVPSHVSGTPPDAFSATGQLWGSPLYAWGAHAAEGYAWWAGRLGRALALHDTVRIDHFRGLAGYWSVEAGAATALGGRWKQGPGLEFFRGVERALGGGHPLPLVAEDLGVITADVVALRDALGAPGMAVLQFGWEGGPGNPHLPHSHAANAYVYPGTHDNDTTAGWYAAAGEGPRAAFRAYLGTDGGDPAWDAVTMCLLGPARTVVVPMQDVLRLGSAARMNTPGVAAGNWAWRAGPGDFANHGLHSKLRLPRPPPAADPPAGLFASPAAMRVAADLRALVHRYNRLADGQPAVLESE